MPLYFFYTMLQKSQKWPKTQIKGGGGPALITRTPFLHKMYLFGPSLSAFPSASAFLI